jgi:Pregnancy-associated plasma protein-A
MQRKLRSLPFWIEKASGSQITRLFVALLWAEIACETCIAADDFTLNGKAFVSQDEFVRLGYRCGTPSPPMVQRTEDAERIASFREANVRLDEVLRTGTTEIPVYFHVLRNDDGSGDVPDSRLDAQIQTLNIAYKDARFHFTRRKVDRTNNKAWFTMTVGSKAESAAKAALCKDPESALNLYTANISGSLLGWSTYPVDLPAKPKMDGVVILYTSLPGGTAVPYNLGKTAVHEIGHWLGLYHTFQDGCTPPGDEVDDTPPEASSTTGSCAANKGKRTCPGSPGDDISNYMDYADDDCMDHFTPGQINRMHLQVTAYRPNLVPSSLRSLFKLMEIN